MNYTNYPPDKTEPFLMYTISEDNCCLSTFSKARVNKLKEVCASSHSYPFAVNQNAYRLSGIITLSHFILNLVSCQS